MVVCSSLGSVAKEEGHLQASLTTRQCSHLRVAICRLFRLATIRVNRSDAALHSALTTRLRPMHHRRLCPPNDLGAYEQAIASLPSS